MKARVYDMDNILLRETAARIEGFLGDALDALTLERAVLGLFFTGVKLSDGSGGLCFTPVKDIPQAVCCPSEAKAMPLSGSLRDRPARACLEDLFHENILRRTLAIAALNALSASCWKSGIERGSYSLETGVDAFDVIDLKPGQKTVVVGALVPLLKKLLAAGAEFRVLEQDVSTLKPREMPFYLPPERAPEVVPQADILVITGATILNGTLLGLLALARKDAGIFVAGPTASMLPDSFFSHGVSCMGGVMVTKPDELLDVIGEAGSGYHFFGKFAERLIIRRGRTG
ncbi:MAG: DUF364 domain-containing protein [Spirochaetaceae bacterium]|jgi:uncharacterized protein (DUF4213/DUF364 family)|nr:DUF364 domain-containing protein [Spirochaetaceae bacterium]